MKLDVRDSFAHYQLNNSELVRLAREPQKHEEFCKTDTREEYTPAELDQALSGLGLASEKARLEALQEPWSSLDCAVYRRLGLPHHEPAPVPAAACPSLANAGLALFDRLDADRDGRLASRELENGLRSDQFHGKEAAALVMLHCEQSLLKGAVRDGSGITRADLEHLRDQGLEGESARLTTGLAGREALAESLPTRRPIMQESFDPDGLRQAKSGTCASLATLLGQTSDQIRGMFADNGDGTITVTLGDGSHQRLSDVTDAERVYQASGSQGERWPALIELAIGNRLKQLGGHHKFDDRSPRSYIALGQSYDHTFRMMAASPCRRIELSQRSPQRARQELNEALTQGTVVAGSRQGIKNGVVGNHAYRVTHFDPDNDRVTLRNPWHKTEWLGSQDGNDDGTFQMPFLQFYASYSTLAVNKHESLLTRGLFLATQAANRCLGQLGIWLFG